MANEAYSKTSGFGNDEKHEYGFGAKTAEQKYGKGGKLSKDNNSPGIEKEAESIPVINYGNPSTKTLKK
jgi:hypothetical protein